MAFKLVGVAGAGIMGRGIAQVTAMAGYEVMLYDVFDAALAGALKIIEKDLSKGVEKGKTTPAAKELALKNITATSKLEDLAGADLVIEAAPEDLAVKLPLFEKLDRLCPPETILASNTTSQSITEIASVTGRTDKVIGLHFFNPVHLMRLVEMVKGLETSGATYDACQNFCRSIGKETVKIKEAPGFVTSRLNAVIGNEAFNMLLEGVGSPEDIDKAVKLGLNHPMGPFEMIDLVGLDTRLKSLEYLQKMLGEKYRPCPLHVQYVKAGRLGRKTGKGVYEYNGDGTRKK
ncbi:MAG: 3-hydroxybutyryl-CoA dehydrogenase [Acidaminococcales bacterium]|jgi:3-hydroxybutyryl-CoA dehydrogenase|nr:3-hydroxybutyryl-CoA dehydrogenase [Acidaminococcales bacterium]